MRANRPMIKNKNNDVYFFLSNPFNKDIVWLKINTVTEHKDHHSAQTINTKTDFLPLHENLSFISHHYVVCSCSRELCKQSTEKNQKSPGSRSTGLFLIIQKNISDNAPFDSFVRVLLLLTLALGDIRFNDEDWVSLIISGVYWLWKKACLSVWLGRHALELLSGLNKTCKVSRVGRQRFLYQMLLH